MTDDDDDQPDHIRTIGGTTWTRRPHQPGQTIPASAVVTVDNETGQRYIWTRQPD